MKLEYYEGGYTHTVVYDKITAEQVLNAVETLENEQNTCISWDKSRVYNNSMTPLYSNGEVCLAWKENGLLRKSFKILEV